ncbi:UDPglucose 6-dehydrogenase [Alteribacillus iranensis]|uniref:UDPglucose 6-dehydrogenase n=1 Tax=Alteribacillus iranensis TaxID=930128 RepID=A0A1I2BGM5_9BACI|nr:UDPglucose 6-dehydrogenase [Alteribacillus iranensis]
MSKAILFAQHHEVTAFDISREKVNMNNDRISPIADKDIEDVFASNDLHLTATTNKEKAFRDAAYVVISTPTNYDPKKNYFDTSSVECDIADVLAAHKEAVIVIKSTVPVGYT